IPVSLDVNSCAPVLDAAAGTFDCVAKSDGISILYTPGVPASPWVDFDLGIHFTITPNGGIATRSFFMGGTAGLPNTDLDITPNPATEPISVPCNQPVGTDVQYALDPYNWSPADTKSVQQPEFSIGITDPFLGIGKISLFSAPFGPAVTTHPA